MKAVLVVVAVVAVLCLTACGGDPAKTENGTACEADTCESGLCLEEFADGVEVVEGICTDECMWTEGATDTCVEGEVCLRYNATGEFYCFLTCETTEDCRVEDGWYCECMDSECSSKACIPPL